MRSAMALMVWLAGCGTVSHEPDGGADGAPPVDGAGEDGAPGDAPDGAADVDASPCGDCGAPTCVALGECAFEGDVCDESGVVFERCTPKVCVDLECVDGTPFDQMVPCERDTDTASCGADVCTDSGSCVFEGNPTCDETGMKPQTCVPKVCAGGVCGDGASFARMVACSRNTDGTTCATQTCTDTTSCAYDTPCDESGSKTQSCVAHTCRAGACADEAPTTRTVSCSRVTDGIPCGATTAGCPLSKIRDLCCSSTASCTTACGPCL